MSESQTSGSISTKLERIAMLAKEKPEQAFRSLAHHIDVNWLREAYRRTRKDGALGVDGRSAREYAANLEENLQSLLDRAKSGTYVAPPVRRVRIPKGRGNETRPIGIPTFEDKVLQRAVGMLLGAVYEQDFLDCSYGFRPGRSAHQAVAAFQHKAIWRAGGWVLEIDIRKFFDSLDHTWLRRILRQRVQDGVLLRLIGKWLRAGVLEEGIVRYPESGSPQGGVISPLLANVFLHEVLDRWLERDVKPRLRGKAWLFRYADDAVLLFEREQDARRVFDVIAKRFAKYGLTLHPEKTRLVHFVRPDRLPRRAGDRPGRPETFDFLGFTYYWTTSFRGKWVVKMRTASSHFSGSLRRVRAWCRRHRHDELGEQQQALVRKLRGHYGYFGLPGNADRLWSFRYEVVAVWRKWLNRRSQRHGVSWEKMDRLLQRYPLPQPRTKRLPPQVAVNP